MEHDRASNGRPRAPGQTRPEHLFRLDERLIAASTRSLAIDKSHSMRLIFYLLNSLSLSLQININH